MKVTRCLGCGCDIEVGEHPRLFQEILCPRCGQSFVVIEIYPVEICYPMERHTQQDPDHDLAFPAGEGESLD